VRRSRRVRKARRARSSRATSAALLLIVMRARLIGPRKSLTQFRLIVRGIPALRVTSSHSKPSDRLP